jgi:hypothetical protein
MLSVMHAILFEKHVETFRLDHPARHTLRLGHTALHHTAVVAERSEQEPKAPVFYLLRAGRSETEQDEVTVDSFAGQWPTLRWQRGPQRMVLNSHEAGLRIVMPISPVLHTIVNGLPLAIRAPQPRLPENLGTLSEWLIEQANQPPGPGTV